MKPDELDAYKGGWMPMTKPLTEQQAKMLQALQQSREKKANQSKSWQSDSSKVKRSSGPGINPHIPQKKP